MASEPFSYEKNPFDNVRGFRAASFRLLYTLLMRLKPWTEKQRLLRVARECNRACHRRWDSEYASPVAGIFASLLICLLIGLGAVLITSRLAGFKDHESGRITPTERTRIAIHQA
jgi:hypothetical protein